MKQWRWYETEANRYERSCRRYCIFKMVWNGYFHKKWERLVLNSVTSTPQWIRQPRPCGCVFDVLCVWCLCVSMCSDVVGSLSLWTSGYASSCTLVFSLRLMSSRPVADDTLTWTNKRHHHQGEFGVVLPFPSGPGWNMLERQKSQSVTWLSTRHRVENHVS